MKEVYIVDGVRTPIGRMGGALSGFRPEELAAIALNLVASGHFLDVAARDVAMAVSAYVLARLAPLHEPAAHEAGKPELHAPAHT